jgi:type VI secretion system protein ImpA
MALNDRDPFYPDVNALLKPIAGADSAGSSMRYDPQYLAIRTAREEDDASLPMGEWERPLKRADWRAVATHCVDILGNRSKDFQVAAWMCEAWTRQHHIEGFNAALQVMIGLAREYWASAYPQIDGDDDDARAATFIWMNENLPRILMLHVPLLTLHDRQPSTVSLNDWDQALAHDNQKTPAQKPNAAQTGSSATRQELIAGASGANGASLHALIEMRAVLQKGAADWDALSKLIDMNMGQNAPSISKVGEVLQRLDRAAASLINGRSPTPIQKLPLDAAIQSGLEPSQLTKDAPMDTPTTSSTYSAQESAPSSGPIQSRADAYRMLEAVAAYLQKTEPHSPTPYLVKRAVTWGHMSLADLMQEVVREEGDIARYFSLLGIKESRE